MNPTRDTEALLRAALAKTPTDRTGWLALADLLAERGREAEARQVRDAVAVSENLETLAATLAPVFARIAKQLSAAWAAAGENMARALRPAIEAMNAIAAARPELLAPDPAAESSDPDGGE